jgi:hypothetical protein
MTFIPNTQSRMELPPSLGDGLTHEAIAAISPSLFFPQVGDQAQPYFSGLCSRIASSGASRLGMAV